MSCVIRIAGKKFDIDTFILQSNLKGFVKRYKEESMKSKRKGHSGEYSFISAIISEADLDSFEKQLNDAIGYLKKNRKKLELIKSTKEIDFATINFMISLKSVSKDYFAQYVYLPKDLTVLCGNLNLGIEVSIV